MTLWRNITIRLTTAITTIRRSLNSLHHQPKRATNEEKERKWRGPNKAILKQKPLCSKPCPGVNSPRKRRKKAQLLLFFSFLAPLLPGRMVSSARVFDSQESGTTAFPKIPDLWDISIPIPCLRLVQCITNSSFPLQEPSFINKGWTVGGEGRI